MYMGDASLPVRDTTPQQLRHHDSNKVDNAAWGQFWGFNVGGNPGSTDQTGGISTWPGVLGMNPQTHTIQQPEHSGSDGTRS